MICVGCAKFDDYFTSHDVKHLLKSLHLTPSCSARPNPNNRFTLNVTGKFSAVGLFSRVQNKSFPMDSNKCKGNGLWNLFNTSDIGVCLNIPLTLVG